MDEIALVTAISGVCSECATFQITVEADEAGQHEDDEVLHEARRRREPDQQQQHAADDQQRRPGCGCRP